MDWLNSKETMARAVKGTVQFIKKADKPDEFCEDMIVALIKEAYLKGRLDVNTGFYDHVMDIEIKYSHTF